MKTFIKVLASLSLSLYAIISFINLNLDVRNWSMDGRFIYVVACLFFSFIITAIIESDKLNNRL